MRSIASRYRHMLQLQVHAGEDPEGADPAATVRDSYGDCTCKPPPFPLLQPILADICSVCGNVPGSSHSCRIPRASPSVTRPR